jgi:signal transduction histidine kinase
VERAGHRLVLDLAPGLWIDSHPLALEQVLDHLLQNALVHGLAGVEDGCLTLRVQAQGSDVLLSVVDNGVGMDAGAQARYFDPFFTSKMERGHSGLGGYAVYSIVVGLLGGQVRVESRLGAGTSIHLQLPVQAPGPVSSSAPDRA